VAKLIKAQQLWDEDYLWKIGILLPKIIRYLVKTILQIVQTKYRFVLRKSTLDLRLTESGFRG
jgi:hypothetical protein